jgi:hypothetical protein
MTMIVFVVVIICQLAIGIGLGYLLWCIKGK